ncbi:MAG: hypothetical protein WAS21_07105 [Geminicoccaceae bacterium]
MPDSEKKADTLEARSQREAEEFFWRVGYAITRWAHVDRALFDFCKFSLKVDDKKIAIIFYKQANIGDHVGLVDSLMRTTVDGRHLKEWCNIVKDLNKILPFRNDLAHNPPTQVVRLYGSIDWEKDKDKLPRSEQWWAVRTESAKLHKGSARKVNAKLEDIREHISSVELLLKSMRSLLRSLPSGPIKPDAESPSPKSPPESGSD